MTPEAAALAALNAHAATLGAGFPPLLYRSVGDDLPDEYIMVDHLPNRSASPYVGNTRQDLQGVYQLTLARRSGQHEIVYHEQAGLIVAHFVDACRLTADGKTVNITDATAGQGRADESRWAVPISIYYNVLA